MMVEQPFTLVQNPNLTSCLLSVKTFLFFPKYLQVLRSFQLKFFLKFFLGKIQSVKRAWVGGCVYIIYNKLFFVSRHAAPFFWDYSSKERQCQDPESKRAIVP